ncbi:hypothetical protein TELCIR_16615 [Teladorsagia circumcincta]|uniref:Peptidase M12A domain-containing protein n=1 Tax=Teladorsagia circumcincta TaxID=45464 RepID=A0A2G9TVA3_TELCI|nr:hypothetical protein TELCIR_16615 [Teladorsagia circumcincta]
MKANPNFHDFEDYFHERMEITESISVAALCAGKGVTGKCTNGGVPNPRNCNACICPNGYGGTLCGQRAPAGKKIQIKVTALTDVICYYGCPYSSIEPKIMTDKAMTSPREECFEVFDQTVCIQHTHVIGYASFTEYGTWVRYQRIQLA